MASSQRITVHTIARDLGVSASTVSLALRHSSLARESTGERIREYAAAVKYVPNRIARSLRQQSSGMIGWIAPSMVATADAELLDQLSLDLFKQGYDLQLYLSQASLKQEANALRRCLAAQVEGLILTPSFVDPAELPADHPLGELDAKRIPHVLLAFPMPGHATIARSPRQAVADAYCHLRQEGYASVHLLALESERVPIKAQERYLGFRDIVRTLERRPIAPGEVVSCMLPLQEVAGSTSDGQREVQYRCDSRRIVTAGEEMARRVLAERRGEEPIGLICNNDQVAAGAMRVCHERRLRIPQDVGLVGFDDSLGPDLDLTSVRWDTAAMTASIWDSLRRQRDGDTRVTATRIGGVLVPRASTQLRASRP
jgi:LacI family transcriptional regulator